jgi:methyl-accepting chemotaxis protein
MATLFEINSTSANRQKDLLTNRLNFIKNLALVVAILAVIGTGTSIWSVLAEQSGVVVIASGVVAFCFSLVSYLTVRFGSTPVHAEIAGYLLIGAVWSSMAIAHLQETTPVGAVSIFLIAAVLCGLLELGNISRWIINVATYLMLCGLYILDETRRLARPNPGLDHFDFSFIVCLSIVYGVIAGGIAIFIARQKRTSQLVQSQETRLIQLVEILTSTNRFGATLSQDLSGVTAKLSATSQQHSTSNQQMSSTLNEVTTSLEELAETASQIATSAAATNQEASQTLQIANQVKEIGELVQFTSQEGRQAVVQTLSSVEQVRNRIELLGQRLLALTTQTSQVASIMELIDQIADETHLLALNASIEAAGSINAAAPTEAQNSRGERFGIIAQEVKNLADRSRESTEEVREAITEMQGAVAAAVLVAEEGKKETAAALTRAQMAGIVIEKLSEVITDTVHQAEQILNAAETVKVRAEEISMATGQQRSASQQLFETMRQLTRSSQESALLVSQLSQAAHEVNHQAAELNQLLAESSRSLLSNLASNQALQPA